VSSWWVHNLYQQGRTVELVSWIFWVIFSITLHELAHGWVALWQGDDTPRRMGRMTLNPLVHMGPWSLLVFALIGIAWGVMPVDPSRFRWGRKGRVVVSGAGPAMNIALCFAVLTLLIIWLAAGPQGNRLYRNVAVFLWTGGWLNIILAVLNLLPVPPLDGASILSGLSRRMYRLYQHPQAQLAGLLLILAVFFTGIFGYAVRYCTIPAVLYVDLAGSLFGSPPVFQVVNS
jgi:Zn-dependent protease